MPITNYDKYMPEAQRAGALANYQDYQANTKPAGEVIAYGAPVSLNATGDSVLVVDAGTTPYGIAMAQPIHEWETDANDQNYAQYKPVAVIRKGVVWVTVAEDVTEGETASVNPANGSFYPSDTATAGVVAFPTAAFRSSAAAGGLAQIEINLP